MNEKEHTRTKKETFLGKVATSSSKYCQCFTRFQAKTMSFNEDPRYIHIYGGPFGMREKQLNCLPS